MNKRGFEKIKLNVFEKAFGNYFSNINKEYENIILPTRKTSGSAGYDFITLFPFTLKPNESIIIPTGIKAFFGDDEFLAIYIRSSLGIKKQIALMNQVGIIDSDYYNNGTNDGHIMIGLFNYGQSVQTFNRGDAIAQGIFQKYLLTSDDELHNKANHIKRLGGIGSTNHGN